MKRTTILISIPAAFIVVALLIIVTSTSNKRPIADSNIVTTAEDTPVSITLVGSDPDADPLSYSVLTSPSHGTVSGTGPELIYTPNANFSGPDSLTFTVNDGSADSVAATVSITVTAVNDPPVADDDVATTQEDAPVVTIDVLANDADADDDRLTVINVSQGGNGSVTINTDGTMSYVPNANFCGTDQFSYTVSDGRGQSDTAKVTVTVKAVNDAPVITSKPVTTASVWSSYSYDVIAKDPDPADTLTYSLTTKAEGMTIEAATGRIEWQPTGAQAGTYDVLVRVADSNNVPASDTQSFTVTVPYLSSPLTTTLTVEDSHYQKGKRPLSADAGVSAVRTSDDIRCEIDGGSYICYDFSDASIPEGAAVVSVVVYVEHFEEKECPAERLKWSVGTGWPDKPVVWASIDAPVRQEESSELTDSWDITSAPGSPQELDSLQLQIRNNNTSARKKTSVDYVYVVVKWY